MKKFFLNKSVFLSAAITLWCLSFLFLSDLTEDVVNSEQIVNFDKYFAGLFLSWRTLLGVKIFSTITVLGGLQLAMPLIVVITLFLIFKKYQTFVLPFILTVVSAELVTFVGKLLIQRVRPEDGAVVMLDFSFPSGHATIAMALYGFLAYFIYKKTKNKLVIIMTSLLILLIGFSRLYLGVHYVSDILAGYLVGLLSLILGTSLSEWLEFRSKHQAID